MFEKKNLVYGGFSGLLSVLNICLVDCRFD